MTASPTARPVIQREPAPRGARNERSACRCSEATAGSRREPEQHGSYVLRSRCLDGGGVALERATKEGARWPQRASAADAALAVDAGASDRLAPLRRTR